MEVADGGKKKHPDDYLYSLYQPRLESQSLNSAHTRRNVWCDRIMAPICCVCALRSGTSSYVPGGPTAFLNVEHLVLMV